MPDWVFLGHDDLARLRKMRSEGKLEEAERILRQGEPSEAVLDELRKVASKRAHIAKRQDDWGAVVDHLESYTNYARQWRQYCLNMVNAEPPEHTSRDKKLLAEAQRKSEQWR